MRGGWRCVVAGALAAVACASSAAPRGWTLVDLGTLGGPGSYGAAISSSGSVVGCADRADGTAHAFIYSSGAMRDLGAGSDAPGSSCALAVNGVGVAAGRSSGGTLVIWNGAAVIPLGISGDGGGSDSQGVVVGSWRGGPGPRAFRYPG